MKIQSTTNTIEQIGNITQEAQFKMKTSRKAFQILSDLYSDKPLAIVRELGANAKDAMVAAGKGGQAFHVKLPNALEPWLVIEDMGTGISHEDIYNVYTTYFESTKSESNDFVGCLGLGSKSPFCYTDNFLITSIHNGVKRIYNAFFNQNNTPAISLMSTENTDRDSGLAIQIPIKNDDFERFNNAVSKAFRFFKIKPIITGGNIDWKINKVLFEGEGWESHEGFGYGECYAVMGGVTYPVDRYKLTEESQRLCNKGGLVMYFEIGQLDVTPSRESLSYDEATIKALNEKFAFIKGDFEKRFSQTIADKTNLLEAIRAHWNLNQQFSHLFYDFSKVKWNGIDLSNPAQLILKLSKGGEVVTHSYTTYGRSKFRESSQPTIATDAVWYVNDLDKGSVARIKQHLRNNNDAMICLFSKPAYDALVNNTDPNYKFDASMFVPVSTLPKVVHVSKGGTRAPRKTGFNIYKFGTGWHNTWDSYPFDASKPPKFYLVKGTDWGIHLTTPFGVYRSKSELRDLLKFLKFSENDIVMVTTNNAKHLAGISTNFLDYVKTKKVNVDKDDIATISKYNGNSFSDLKKHPKFKNLKQDSDFVVFVNKIVEAFKKVSGYENILRYLPRSVEGGTAITIKGDCPITNLCVDRVSKYGWSTDDILTIMENFQK